jgi:hypothetical protein
LDLKLVKVNEIYTWKYCHNRLGVYQASSTSVKELPKDYENVPLKFLRGFRTY